MFGFLKKKVDKLEVFSPLDGEAVNITKVKDAVFSEKMLGDGVAIIPDSGKIYAPVDGVLVKVFGTKHAYAINTESGLELLIHCGIDTVELGGEGFVAHKESGATVQKGELIAEMDLELIAAKGKDLITPIVITNFQDFENLVGQEGQVKAGDLLFSVKKK